LKRLGEKHQRAKLTDAQVEAIRSAVERGASYRQVAENFHISKGHVFNLVRFKSRVSIFLMPF
jgi:predicted DNA binding protein